MTYLILILVTVKVHYSPEISEFHIFKSAMSVKHKKLSRRSCFKFRRRNREILGLIGEERGQKLLLLLAKLCTFGIGS